jgi:hypothetical protein
MTWHVDEVPNNVSGAGESPLGVSVRQWGPTSDVFVFFHGTREMTVGGQTYNRQAGRLKHYTCDPAGGGYDYCETATLDNDDQIGPFSRGNHLLHPAMAIKGISGGRELRLSRAEFDYGGANCPVYSGGQGQPDQEQWDLVAYKWNTTNGSISDQAIEAAFSANECTDFGITELAFDGSGTARAYYTHGDPATHDAVHCNEEATGSTWNNVIHYEALGGLFYDADHPSFVLDGGDPIVVHHETNGTAHAISFRPADPLATDFSFDNSSVSTFRKDHPRMVKSTDGLRVVYMFAEDANARLMYRWCDDLSGDCDDYTADPTNTGNDDWYEEVVTGDTDHHDVNYPEIRVDYGERREFVAFSYDANGTLPGQHRRVAVGTRCIGAGNSWSFFEPRTPPSSTWDQVLHYGRPSLVLDKNNDMLHLVFVEAEEWETLTPDYDSGGVGDVYWARASYADADLGDCN